MARLRLSAVLAVAVALVAPAAASAAPADRAHRAADRLDRAHVPYALGGGHGGGSWRAGLDCSGSVSWVLERAGVIRAPMDSYGFEGWGRAGRGNRITVWIGPGHVWMEVDGHPFGTSSQNPSGGPGWFDPYPGYVAGFEPRRPAAGVRRRAFG